MVVHVFRIERKEIATLWQRNLHTPNRRELRETQLLIGNDLGVREQEVRWKTRAPTIQSGCGLFTSQDMKGNAMAGGSVL